MAFCRQPLWRQPQACPERSALAWMLHLVSPNLTTMVGLVLTGASLAIEWGGGLHWLVPTVLVAVVGGVLSAWLFLVEYA